MTTAAEIQAKMDLLSANMDRLDGITNGGPADTVSTTGGSVPSWAKFLADRELDAAYIAAMAAAGLYASEADGLAATTDGDYFLVKGSGATFASLFLNDGGSAVSQDLDIPSAEASLNTDYTFTHGSGNRTSVAFIHDLGTGSLNRSGAALNPLIDGSLTPPGAYIYLAPGAAVSGRIVGYFPEQSENASWVADGMKLTVGTAINYGTWEPVGLKDVVWNSDGTPASATAVSLGSSFAITGNVTEITFSNEIPYEAYGIRGVSGTVPASALGTGLAEIEWKGRLTDVYGTEKLPPSPSVGDVVRKRPGGWEAYNPNLNEPEGRDLLNHYWPCDEGQGTILKDVIGGVEIDTTDASLSGNNSGGSVTWDREGVLTLNNAWFGTPSTVAARTLFLVYEVPLRKSVWVMTHPRNGDSLITSTYNQSVTRLRNISGPGIKDLHHRTSDGLLGTGMALGGITGIWVEKAAQQTGSIFFNSGRADGSGASAQTYRLLCVATASGTLTLEQVKKVRLFLARQLAKRDQYMIPEVCPKQCAVAVWSGESTHHTNLIMDNDPTLSGDTSLRKRAYTNTFLTGVDDPIGDGEVNRPFEQLTYWMDQTDEGGYQIGNEGLSLNVRARKMGPLRGFAERHLYAPNKFRAPLFHMKLAVGGTRIAPVGTVDADAGTVSSVESRSPTTGGVGLFPNVLLQGFLQYEAELRRMGYGIRHVHDFRAEGINDAFYLSLSVLTSSSVYQAWLQDEHDDKKAYLGIDPFPTAILVPHLPVPGAAETEVAQLGFVGGYTDDATGQRRLTALLRIRQACRDFATANSDVTAFEGDDYELNTANGDSVHPSLQGLTDMGADYRLAYDFTTAFTEAFDG